MSLPRRLGYGERASLSEHLSELRGRLIIALAGLAVAFGVAYGFRHPLLEALNKPLGNDSDGNPRIPTTFGVAEPFMTSFTVCLYAAVAASLPIILWQVWQFLAPAFEQKDQKTIARLIAVGSGLFVAGLLFSYFVVLPAATPFLLGFDSQSYDIQIRARDYYSFVGLTSLAIGVLFEMPVFVLGLVRVGLLSSARLRRNRRTGIVVCVVIAVLLPGIDPVTTSLQALPLLVLFEASIWLASFFEKRWLEAAARAAAQDLATRASES